ncbi:sulfite oxidase [Sparassis crispa]|uniref:Sulfite oxidase n=1 Tax=Sparassis crispa TaxID=139825 RepID=A0A401GM21_9APHY|nr:sulfite oxidase [Sparassis crispa]GBE83263.1 sulfite oxidase [Sparassis crispa]
MTATEAKFKGIPRSHPFPEEKVGWRGYVEWEDKPDRKAPATQILNTKHFMPPPEFQLVPLPDTNPILIGHRWKEYHEALGLKSIVAQSWATVCIEKPGMIHILDFPYNGEIPREPLLAGKITDNQYHFVRNHRRIPDIDEDAFELEVGGLVRRPVEFVMKELKDPSKFLVNLGEKALCSGTAVYRGISVKNILDRACDGVLPEAKHIKFISADTYFKKNNVYHYAVSIPYRKVKQDQEVLLAWEMNGVALPKIHGFPLRAVVPGVIGARSTKWLYKVNALAEASMGPVQRQEYPYYPSQFGKHNVKCSNGFSIQNMPVSSAIMFLLDKQVIIHEGSIEFRGWAYSGGGGNWVERVDVSPDGGYVWYSVELGDMTEKHYWTWQLWKIRLPVDASSSSCACAHGTLPATQNQPLFAPPGSEL